MPLGDRDPIAVQWGKRIRARRLQLEKSQDDLAADVGVTKASISKWERGYSAPTWRNQDRIAGALLVDVDWLFPRQAVQPTGDAEDAA